MDSDYFIIHCGCQSFNIFFFLVERSGPICVRYRYLFDQALNLFFQLFSFPPFPDKSPWLKGSQTCGAGWGLTQARGRSWLRVLSLVATGLLLLLFRIHLMQVPRRLIISLRQVAYRSHLSRNVAYPHLMYVGRQPSFILYRQVAGYPHLRQVVGLLSSHAGRRWTIVVSCGLADNPRPMQVVALPSSHAGRWLTLISCRQISNTPPRD